VTITDGGPDLVVSSLTGPTIVERGATVTYSEVTRNSGTATAGASVTEYYLSANATYDRLDMLIADRAVPILSAGEATRPFSTTVTVPLKIATGTYYLIAVADGNRSVLELSETNNTRYLKIVVR
jgi:trimeric autotransporter adhesin